MSTRAIDTLVRDAALACRDAGISVLPANWRTKQPQFNLLPRDPETDKAEWKLYQVKVAAEDVIRGWFARGLRAFAVACGALSKRYVLDFDLARLYYAWREQVGELVEQGVAEGHIYVEKSGRPGGGFHVVLCVEAPPGNEVLAYVADQDAEDESGRIVGIETRGEGGYCVVAPSVHPCGARYEAVEGSLLNLKTCPAAWLGVLVAAARDLDEMPVTRQQVALAKAAASRPRKRQGGDGGPSVIDAFNDRHDVGQILKANGYTEFTPTRLNRPGGGSPGSIHLIDGLSFHFSTNDPLNDGRFGGFGCHDAFGAFARLKHGGDVAKAVRAAAVEMGMEHRDEEQGGNAADHDAGDDAGNDGGGAKPAGPVLMPLCDVVSRPVEWLWAGRIALGKITLIVGDPGLGKSFLTCDLSFHVSTGAPWPDDPIDAYRSPAGVIILNAEDGLDDTIRPRLDAAGADVTRVVALEGVAVTDPETHKTRTRSFTLARDLPNLERALELYPETRLVIVDPVSAYLGDADSHSNAEVRGLLAPLSALAGRHGVAMVLVSHLNKGGGSKSVYRVNGSLAFPAAARAAWLVAKDPVDPDRRLLLNVKNNLAPDSGGLAYRIVDGRLAWEATPVSVAADDVLGAGERPPGKCEGAEGWLREYLEGGARPVPEIEAEAKAAGITARTLRRAREALGIRPRKAGFGLGWCWALPVGGQGDHAAPATESWTPSGSVGHLRVPTPETHTPEHTLPLREAQPGRRWPSPGGRGDVGTFGGNDDAQPDVSGGDR